LPFFFPAYFVSYPLNNSKFIVYHHKNDIAGWENYTKYNSKKKLFGKQTTYRYTHILLFLSVFYFYFSFLTEKQKEHIHEYPVKAIAVPIAPSVPPMIAPVKSLIPVGSLLEAEADVKITRNLVFDCMA
jgi:hypothetical protein